MGMEGILKELEHFYFSKTSFILNFEDSFSIPQFLGSTIRGGFGYAFKNAICLSKLKRECKGCLLVENCPYSLIFEGIIKKELPKGIKEVPKPFIIDLPAIKKENQKTNLIEFNLVIIGKITEFFPYFFLAFSSLGERGIGKNRRGFKIEKIEQIFPSKKLIYKYGDEELGKIENSFIKFILPEKEITTIKIKFLTPVKIKYEGRLLSVIEFHHLIRALLRRIYLLSIFWCDYEMKIEWESLIKESEKVKISKCELKWQDYIRYSSRQKQKMKIGGVTGMVEYKGEINKFLPILKLGEFIHVGKNTSFGLGKYSLSH